MKHQPKPHDKEFLISWLSIVLPSHVKRNNNHKAMFICKYYTLIGLLIWSVLFIFKFELETISPEIIK